MGPVSAIVSNFTSVNVDTMILEFSGKQAPLTRVVDHSPLSGGFDEIRRYKVATTRSPWFIGTVPDIDCRITAVRFADGSTWRLPAMNQSAALVGHPVH